MICGTEKGEVIKQTKKKKFDVIINEAGSTSFQNSILAGQWFAMKADMFIFVILNKLKACWKSGEMKKGQEEGKMRIHLQRNSVSTSPMGLIVTVQDTFSSHTQAILILNCLL